MVPSPRILVEAARAEARTALGLPVPEATRGALGRIVGLLDLAGRGLEAPFPGAPPSAGPEPGPVLATPPAGPSRPAGRGPRAGPGPAAPPPRPRPGRPRPGHPLPPRP